MNGEQNENNKPEKKNKAAIAGFIFGLALFAVSISGIYGVVLLFTAEFHRKSLLLFLLICFLITIPTLLISIFGILRKKQRIFAIIGLFLSIFCAFVVLPFRHIKMTPPGSLPLGLEIYKFHKACPAGDFWLSYDKTHITDVRCLNTWINWQFGVIHFKNKPGSYREEHIIEYAKQNGWKNIGKGALKKEDFEKLINGKLDDDELRNGFFFLRAYCIAPLLLYKDCNVLVFDINSPSGILNYIMAANDGDEIVVRFADPLLPTGMLSKMMVWPKPEELEEMEKKEFSK